MRIYFWTDMFSFYQVPHVVGLAAQDGVEVTWIAATDLESERAEQGWPVIKPEGVRCISAPSDEETINLCKESGKDDVHLILGPRGHPLAVKVAGLLKSSPSTVGLLIDNRDAKDKVRHVRNFLWTLDRFKYNKLVKFILVVGFCEPNGGEVWYRKLGYPAAKLFPYIVFPLPPSEQDIAPRPVNEKFELIYVGSYIQRKGIDVLIKAMALLKDIEWNVKLVGGGPEQANLEGLVKEFGLEGRCQFIGNMPNHELMTLVSKSDLMVLPSRFDGWGVVVSEAIMRGIPSICSDMCGAKDILDHKDRGTIFKTNDVADLARVLRAEIGKGPVQDEKRQKLIKWSECMRGEVGADYILSVIKHVRERSPRPKALWLD